MVNGPAPDARAASTKSRLRTLVVTLSATSPDAGSATEEIEVEYKDTALEIGFNSRYLLDITEQIAGTEARFLMADAGSPTLVRDGADESALYVLMPMRV